MADQIPAWLKSIYAYGCCALLVVVLVIVFARARKAGYRKAWAPLAPVIHGHFTGRRWLTTMSGEYGGRPVTAHISRGGEDFPDLFTVRMHVPVGGRDRELAHRSEKFLGPESWRVFTKDPALQEKLNAAGVPSRLRNWPEQTVVEYIAGQGALELREEMLAPSAKHFKAQLDLLDALAAVNRELNG